MNALDWFIIVIYLCGMIGLSVHLGRNQSDEEDYFVGGRKLSWWSVGISTMATQTSAISFISIPAFVALREGGGLTWLQYELAVPLAIILVMVFLIPFFRRLRLVSVYEYLEFRFGPSVRYLVGGVFLVSRGLGTGVGVYASAIVLAVCLNIPLWSTILLIGVVTVIYDTIGGITAVVYSDVIQMIILFSGIILCITYAADIVGGLDDVWSAFPVSRRAALDPSLGLSDAGASVPFWPFLVGRISETVIESINKIGSAFYGPILAAFVVGVISRKATARSVTAGILSGVGVNLLVVDRTGNLLDVVELFRFSDRRRRRLSGF
jgi:SSS family solute:Na+ symporter